MARSRAFLSTCLREFSGALCLRAPYTEIPSLSPRVISLTSKPVPNSLVGSTVALGGPALGSSMSPYLVPSSEVLSYLPSSKAQSVLPNLGPPALISIWG